MRKRSGLFPAAVLATMIMLAATLNVCAEEGTDGNATPPPAAKETPATEGAPPTPEPAKKPAKKKVKKKRAVRRGDQGEKLTVQQVAEIQEEKGDLTGKDLRGLNLVGFNLKGAKLAGSTLAGANLERADLQEANLERADLTKANLRQANLRYANITSTNLEGANLEGAIWLDGNVCAKGSVGACRDVTRP